MAADASNPKGYWESTVLYELHERLLRAADSRWDACTRLDPGRLRSLASADLGEECRQAIRTEFGSSDRFVLKDPRMCRFVPFWLQVLESEGVAPAAILVVRSPMEVARSLAVRNGFERDLSLLIWLRHVLDVEFQTRSVRRTLLRYQDVITDWRSAANRVAIELGVSWRSRTRAEEEESDRFVSAGLRHHRDVLDATDGIAPVLAEWLTRASAALQRLHDHDSDPSATFAELDALRLEFDRATSVIGDVSDRIRGGLEAEVSSLEARRAALGEQVAGLQRHVHAVEHESVALRRELSLAHQDAKALRQSASWRVTAPLRAAYRILRPAGR
jgi:hypothetical protein